MTRSSDPTILGYEALFGVQDNGEGNSPPDLMSLVNVFSPEASTADCLGPGEIDFAPVEGGNIQVRP